MEYLIRFVQMHETFRKPEIEALADLNGLNIEWKSYSQDSPYAVVRIAEADYDETIAKALVCRSILCSGIYELWGAGSDYESLHENVRLRSSNAWEKHRHASFHFEVDCFQGKQSTAQKREIIELFDYTGFEGPIRMHNPDNEFMVFEEYDLNAAEPKKLYFGRLVAESGRRAVNKYSLKKRSYISTTSMDAELSLVTANMALAATGRLAYDPFMGTGSFPLACAHFGATVFGSDFDGRSIRGKKDCNVRGNFAQYDTLSRYLGGFVSDLTNTPLRNGSQWLDAIVCDPPYGVREGLKVLGSNKAALQEEVLLADGKPAHLAENYVPPRKAYSFLRMLDDILDFGAETLVADGRLCMWMPVAGVIADDVTQGDSDQAEDDEKDKQEEYDIPCHPALRLVSECTQHFNKWSRRLLTYQRLHAHEVSDQQLVTYKATRLALAKNLTGTADDLNTFRKKYFQGFRDPCMPRQHERLPHRY